MVSHATLYEEVTKIAEDYFGPVAPRLMSRLISSHLGKDPSKLMRKDLAQLSAWTKLTLSTITDDERTIEEFASRLQGLAAR